MGSDGDLKSSQNSITVAGVRITRRCAKFTLGAVVCLMATALLLQASWPKGATPQVLAGALSKQPTATPKPVPTGPPPRPASDSAEYDQYFAQQALSFSVGSDFDISASLRKQGFRGTRNWIISQQRSPLIRGSKIETIFKTHTDWMNADWRSLNISQTVPIWFKATLNSSTDSPFQEADRSHLEQWLDELPEHSFYVEMIPLTSQSMTLTVGSEKIIFSYTERIWSQDQLTTEKFISLIELFTSRKMHGAHTKEFLLYQTPTRPLMNDNVFNMGTTHSLAMMPRIAAPTKVKEQCMSLARANITESLESPLELKVLVVWGKAYMATCFNAICNPFVGHRWRDIDGPRYTVYPDGKSEFINSRTFSPDMLKCAAAIDEFVVPKMSGAMAAAERVAVALGAPWLRVDVFLTDSAKQGFMLHKIRTIASSVSGWTGRSERAMQIVARGFEGRSRQPVGKLPPVVSSKQHLAKLGCHVQEAGSVTCGSPAMQTH